MLLAVGLVLSPGSSVNIKAARALS